MVKSITSNPVENATNPSVLFTLELDFNRDKQFISNVSGILKLSDGTILCSLQEFPENISQEFKLAASGTYYDQHVGRQEPTKLKLLAEIGHRGIRKIDEARKKDPKNDVGLKIELRIRYMESLATTAHFFEISPNSKFSIQTGNGAKKDAMLVASVYDDRFGSNKINGWILSGNNGPYFLSMSPRYDEASYRIPSNDWVADYLPKFGYGKYTIIELLSEGELFEVTNKYLTSAEKAFHNWDTKSVFAHCREAGNILDQYAKSKYGASSFIYKERWGRAYSNFENWASLDLHIEDVKQAYKGSDMQIQRADAEHLILTTKLLVKHLQEI